MFQEFFKWYMVILIILWWWEIFMDITHDAIDHMLVATWSAVDFVTLGLPDQCNHLHKHWECTSSRLLQWGYTLAEQHRHRCLAGRKFWCSMLPTAVLIYCIVTTQPISDAVQK
jgi:hypothetical protein